MSVSSLSCSIFHVEGRLRGAVVGSRVRACLRKPSALGGRAEAIGPDSRQSSVDATFAVFDIVSTRRFHGPRFVSKRGGRIVPFFKAPPCGGLCFYVLVVILNITPYLPIIAECFRIRRILRAPARMTMRAIYLRVPFGFEMSEVRLQILLSGGLTAGPGGVPGQAKGEVLALV